MLGRRGRETSPPYTSGDLACFGLTGHHDGGIQLGADRVYLLLVFVDDLLIATREVTDLALVGIGQSLLRIPQICPEEVDVVQPGGGTHGLGVVLDQFQCVGVGIELANQPDHRRHIGSVFCGLLDACEHGVEIGRIHDHGFGAHACEGDDDDHEGHQDRQKQQAHDQREVLLERLHEPSDAGHGVSFLRCTIAPRLGV